MYILGIKSGGHESAACLVKDGIVVAAAEEERFNRIKHAKGFPHMAMKWCLESEGITLYDIDYVASPIDPWKGIPHMAFHFLRYFPRTLQLAKERSEGEYMNYFKEKDFVIQSAKADKKKCKFKFVPVEHHIAHAASAFLVSPFEESAILTIDAVGEWTSTMLSYGKGTEIKKIREIEFPHSLGFLYQAFTKYLGFEAGDGEGKVMGLAPYGDWRPYIKIFRDLVKTTPNGGFKLDLNYFDFHIYGHKQMLSEKAMKIFNNPRVPEGKMEKHHKDVAAALQKRLEEVAVHMAKWLQEKTKSENLCLAGGVALNSVMNMKILEETKFKNIFIQPAAIDSGAVLGAAIYASVKKLHERSYVMDHAYLGPEYTDSEFEAALKKARLKYKWVDDIEAHTAKLLARQKIVGWFQGRMELGPRSLGNRAIICDPRTGKMKDILNARVKHREGFRPFAPSVLADRAEEFFDLRGNESPYMLLVPKVRKNKRNAVPAITHVDGTARVQTVREDQNPRYYKLIFEFSKLTKVPVILNTSFNIRGQPIVNTPEEAIKTYLNTGMDVLVLGNYITEKGTSIAKEK